MAEFVECHRFDVEGACHCAHAPHVLAVVKVHGLGQRVGDDAAAGREVGVGQDAAHHRVVRVRRGPPSDPDIRAGTDGHLGERQSAQVLPGLDGAPDGVKLGGAADVVGSGVESERQGPVGPGTRGGEGQAVSAHVRKPAAGLHHRVPGGVVEHAGDRQVEELLEVPQGSFGGVVQDADVPCGGFGQVAEPLKVGLDLAEARVSFTRGRV